MVALVYVCGWDWRWSVPFPLPLLEVPVQEFRTIPNLGAGSEQRWKAPVEI